jgi:hypothetical protein
MSFEPRYQMRGVLALKKKITAILLMFFAMPLLSSALPEAEAAYLEDQLAESIVANTTAAQIQELIQIKDNPGGKEALLGTIAKSAIERSGKADAVNDITTVAAQLLAQDQTDIKNNIVKAVETAARGKVQQEVTDRLAGYQNEMALLSTLLSSSNILTPKAVESNNTLSGAPQNNHKILDVIN